MNEEQTITVDVPSTVEEATSSMVVSKKRKKYNHLGKKDEKYILKRMREFAPMYLIAKELDVCRHTLSSYIRDEMDMDYKDVKEAMIDVAESKLFKNIIDGNQNAIQFFLDRQAKSRGYGEKQLLDRTDVPVINIGKIEIKESDTKEIIEVKQ
jgi:hypothetical protein